MTSQTHGTHLLRQPLRAATVSPTGIDPTLGSRPPGHPSTLDGPRPAGPIDGPRLRGGWRPDPDRGLRLVWRFEPAA